MPLHLYRSNQTEQLVRELVDNLAATQRGDPFEEQPIVVGSRGMERWLRNQIATYRGIAARLAFPFPGPAFDGGVVALLGELDATLPFWHRQQSEGSWQVGALSWRVVMALRELLAEPGCAEAMDRVARYLAEDDAADETEAQPLRSAQTAQSTAISAREQSFASDVASAVDEVLRMRPDVARRWLSPGEQALIPEDERWLALVLRRLSGPATSDTTGAGLHPVWRRDLLLKRLRSGDVTPTAADAHPAMHVFGLSTLPAEELKTLSLISGPTGLEVHLYLLAPCREWFGDLRTGGETRRELRELGGALDSGSISAEQLYERQVEIIEREEQKNRLLADLGRPSRDVQALLELHAAHYEERGDRLAGRDLFIEPTQEKFGTVLNTLQREILRAASGPQLAPGAALPALSTDERSLLLLPCHGPLRQVEVLRAQLLDAFSRDKRLQPRDVLVMTPDIATFAPLVAAVFADERVGERRRNYKGEQVDKLPTIPVDIADLGLRSTNRVADVLLSVLELATERVTLPALLNLLQLPPLRERFGLTGADFADLQRILQGSGVRWGIDAADRASVGQPKLHQNTLAFGLERTALGALFLDETDLMAAGEAPLALLTSVTAAPGTPTTAAGNDAADAREAGPDLTFVPFDALDAESQGRFGRLYACLNTVLHHRRVVLDPGTAAQWQQRLTTLLAELTLTTDASAWLTERVMVEIKELLTAAQQGVGDVPITLATLRDELQGRFELPRKGDRPISGGVSVCALEPMRSVPFRIVALLGMNQGEFPRQSRRAAWHPMARGRRIGEHDSRDIDRHLLLEALLSARDQLLVLWTGFDVQTGDAQPAAVPIRELAETIDARFAWPSTPAADGAVAAGGEKVPPASEWLTRSGPLQPWSEAHFTASAGHRAIGGFDVAMRDAAKGLRELRDGERSPSPAQILPGDLTRLGAEAGDLGPQSVDVPTLARALSNPAKVLLSERFGLRMAKVEVELAEREPLELNSLETWQLRDGALRLMLSGQHGEAASYLASRWRAEGQLPIGPAAEANVAKEVELVVAMMREVVDALQSAALRAIEQVDVRQLTATVTGLSGPTAGVADGLIAATSEPNRAAPSTDPGDGTLGAWGIVLDDALLTPDPQRPGAMLLIVPFVGSLDLKRSLTAWLTLLVATCSRPRLPISGALVVTKADAKKKETAQLTWIQTPTDPQLHLRTSLGHWQRTRRARVPLFKSTSWALATGLLKLSTARDDEARWWSLTVQERQALRGAAVEAWEGGRSAGPGDAGDPWITAIWGEPGFADVLPEPLDAGVEAVAGRPEPDWVATARAVLLPIVAAQQPYTDRQVPAAEGADGGAR